MSGGPVQLSAAERGAFAHFFALADPQNTGVVSASNAVSFFALSGLHSTVLGAVWEAADRDKNGFLTPVNFSIALRLIGHAQGGKVVTDDLISQPGPMPTFKGITLPAHLQGSGAAQTPGSPAGRPGRQASTVVPQTTGGSFTGTATVGEIRPEDRARYTRIFAGAGPQNGLIDGEKAKNIFVKSKLPFEQLGSIWNLADTKSRGQLDLTDFIIGMHFIQCTMNGSLKQVPNSLPSGLYEKAAGGLAPQAGSPQAPMTPQMTGGSAGYLSRQATGSQFSPTPASPARGNQGMPQALQQQRTGTMFAGSQGAGAPGGWAVAPAEKAKADSFFDGLDQENKGVLDGGAAVPFFLQSGLNEATLAHVWDLSDITQSGSLSRDEFAVAMHLINLKLTGTELPQELPANLIPPTLRGQSLPQAVDPQQTDTQKDLFSLMDDDIDLPVSTANAFAVPAPAATPVQGRAAPAAAGTPSKGAFDSAFDDDFLGSSPKPAAPAFFAGSTSGVLSPQATGASASSRATQRQPAAGVGDSSMEAQNTRLALESTQKSLGDLETSKADLSRSVSTDADSISDLKTRLETVRMRHQTESEAVSALRQRYASQAADLKRLREESVREESELSRLKAEKDELEQSLMKDREDVREANRLAAERTKEKEALKAEIEKVKKDARQQKGLLAIGKKQVSQADADVAKAKEELERVKLEGAEEAETQEHAAHGEVPMVADAEAVTSPRAAVVSPALSQRSYNPFDRSTAPPAQGSPHGASAATLGAAALGGAAAAGIGTAAFATHQGTETEKTEKTAQEQADEDDPFGLNTRNEPSTAQAESPADFDDDFGHAAPQGSVAAGAEPSESAGANESFDDAFAEMNEPAIQDKSAAGAADENQEASSRNSQDGNDGLDPTTAIGATEDTAMPGSMAAADEPEIGDMDGAPTSTAKEPADDAAVTGAMHPGTAASGAAADSTVLDKGKGVVRGRDGDSDSSDGDDDGPEDLEGAGHRYAGAGHAQGDETAESKFPALEDSTTESASTALSQPGAEPTRLMAPPIAALRDPAGQSRPESASGISDADAFHDAQAPSPAAAPAAHDAPAAASLEALASPPQAAGGRSTSPAKARRAPPAIPSRPLAADTGAAAAPSNPMDDFDAAFEDLGPTGTTAASNNADISRSSSAGFEDAFGDADGFDFVPSFGNTKSSAMPGQTAGTQPAAPGTYDSSANADAFRGFDSAFDASPFDTSAGRGAAARGGNGQTTNNSSSGAGSGFSFEDAFVPADAIRSGNTPPESVAAAAPPSGPFAPPSGPPPASSQAPPPPPRHAARASAGSAGTAMPATASAASSTGALPDDAGPVKQLCQMGFTRDSVIKALEKSNYRTEKALERLLAQA